MIKVFNHYVPTTILMLLIAEALLLMGAIYGGAFLRFSGFPHDGALDIHPLFPKALIFMAVMISAMTAMGLYQRDFTESVTDMVFRLMTSFFLGLVAIGFLFYLMPGLFLGRGALAIAFVLGMSSVTLARFVFLHWANFDALKQRILVLGTGSRAARIEALAAEREGVHGINIVGYVPLQGTHHYVEPSRIVTDPVALPELARRHQVDEIVIGVRERRGGGLPLEELLQCKLNGVRVCELSSFYERETGQVQLESLNASWIILSEGFRQGRLRDVVKRAFDVAVSSILLFLALPVMVLTAALIFLESGRPVFYRQERVGQGGRNFTILKFRSMTQSAEKDGTPQWAKAGDARVTRVGRVIRKIRIDELPQIFNVLRGDMSFVGPRPERPFFVEQLADEIPYYSARHSLKPGITGWAQVRYPYGASVEDAIEKLQYDLYYVKNHSLFLDLMILFQTAQVVIWGKGAR